MSLENLNSNHFEFLSPELPKWRLNRKSNEFDKSFEVNQTYPKLFNKKTSKQRLDFDTRKESNFSITNETIHDLSSLYYHDFEYSDEEFKDLNPYAAILKIQTCDETSVIEDGNFLVNHYLAYSTSEIQQMTLAQLIAENYEGNLVDIWTKNKLKMKMKLEKVLRSQKLFVILQPIIVKEVEVLVSNIDLTIKSFEAKVGEGGDGAGAAEDNLLFEDDELLGQPLGTIMPQIDIENTLESKDLVECSTVIQTADQVVFPADVIIKRSIAQPDQQEFRLCLKVFLASSGSLLLSAQEGGKIKSCQSEFIQFTFGVSTKRLENMQVTDLIPGFFDSFDISATSSMNSLTVNEDFAATSTPARKHSNKGAAGAKPQELHHEDEFPQGGYYGYGKHANGSEFSILYQVRLVGNCEATEDSDDQISTHILWITRDLEEISKSINSLRSAY